MTVKELKKILEGFDDDLRVFVNGYEGGYWDLNSDIEIKEYALDVNDKSYYGPHIVTDGSDDGWSEGAGEGHEKVKGICLQ